MPWSGDGVFTRTDGTREGSDVWDEARQALVKINAPDMDRHDQDQAEGIQACLAKNGENVATADLPMDGHKHTGVEDAAASDHYAAYGQVLALTTPFIGAASVGGTGNAVELTPVPAIAAYVVGRGYRYFAEEANTDEATISISGLAPVALRRNNGSALEDQDITAGRYVVVIYNGSHFRTNISPPVEEQDDAGLSEGEVELIVAQLVFDFAETGDVSLVPVNKIPNLPAGRITSGTFGRNRIPDLPAEVLTSGELDENRIPVLPASKVGTEIGAVPGRKILHDDGVFRLPFEFPTAILPEELTVGGNNPTQVKGILAASKFTDEQVTITAKITGVITGANVKMRLSYGSAGLWINSNNMTSEEETVITVNTTLTPMATAILSVLVPFGQNIVIAPEDASLTIEEA